MLLIEDWDNKGEFDYLVERLRSENLEVTVVSTLDVDGIEISGSFTNLITDDGCDAQGSLEIDVDGRSARVSGLSTYLTLNSAVIRARQGWDASTRS